MPLTQTQDLGFFTEESQISNLPSKQSFPNIGQLPGYRVGRLLKQLKRHFENGNGEGLQTRDPRQPS
jgi:hypothetical protein